MVLDRPVCVCLWLYHVQQLAFVSSAQVAGLHLSVLVVSFSTIAFLFCTFTCWKNEELHFKYYVLAVRRGIVTLAGKLCAAAFNINVRISQNRFDLRFIS